MICLYCGKPKIDLEAKGNRFSQEHILPKSLIGTPINNIFTIKNVCGVCNNKAGVSIDAPAIRSWFMQSEIALHSYDYAKVEDNPILPLKYMGQMTDLTYKDKVCDSWIGPTGDQIFHFHDPYPNLNSYPAIIGVPPQFKKTADKGFAFIFVRSNNPVWHPTIFKSFIKKFKGSQLYLGNTREKPPVLVFSQIPEELYELHQKLSEIKEIKVGFHFTPFSENRFLAKVALGIGSKFLRRHFEESEVALKLREFMWARTDAERAKIKLKGTHFFDPEKKIETSGFFGWNGGHLISLINLPEQVVLTINLYNSITASMGIEKTTYDYKNEIGDGICIVIVPPLNRIVGPMKYIHFLNHKLNMKMINPELKAIEAELNQIKEKRPPILIQNNELKVL